MPDSKKKSETELVQPYFRFPKGTAKLLAAFDEYGPKAELQVKVEGTGDTAKAYWRVIGPEGNGTEWENDSFNCPPICHPKQPQ